MVDLISLLLTVLLLVSSVHATAASSPSSSAPKILLLDVDNTLYHESDCGIEQQIIKNIHDFVGDAQLADDLHRQYGSTIRGLVANPKLLKNKSQQDFYERVYQSIDVSSLLQSQQQQKHCSSLLTTGYFSGTTRIPHQELRTLVTAVASSCRLGWASNSPQWHVEKIIQALGWVPILMSTRHDDFLTPRPEKGFCNKPDPSFFPHSAATTLVDDSLGHVQALKSVLNRTVHCTSDGGLYEALPRALGWVNHDFQDAKYLAAKNEVDRASLHEPTWDRLHQELAAIRTDSLVVADVGAGLLSMLELFLQGSADGRLSPVAPSSREVHYHAYESNSDSLYEACVEKLAGLGFRQHNATYFEKTGIPTWIVHWHGYDYTATANNTSCVSPHLIVGCCFADLMDPHHLVTSLLSTFGCNRTQSTTLVYFPITFGGITQALPPGRFEGRSVPSDTLAFSIYTQVLREQQGHTVDPDKLVKAMEDYGGELLTQGPSPWNIDPAKHPYLWETMLYFFGKTAAPKLLATRRWDPWAWLDRLRQEPRKQLRVTNVDLLFRLPNLGHWQFESKQEEQMEESNALFEEILFTAPRKVTTVDRTVGPLLPNQVRIQSEYSLISSGTELKIFTGDFGGSALDLTIPGMKDDTMAYPLAYGYSLVGRVVQCGADVDPSVNGKRVFVFAAHASQVVTDVGNVQFVPVGIEARDAVFLPSVETALSLVQDARPIFGEDVAVFGQGLIGLLVTAILGQHGSGSFGTITTFDTVPDRLALSAKLGASQALFPSKEAFEFDVAIEISGNGQALQSAIDAVRNGGRIIIGSWYGDNSQIPLKLGMDFHRSHKQLKASQVSEIPAELMRTWSKQRRFDLAWELVRQIRPSQLITRQCYLEDAEQAYEALHTAAEVAVVFKY